MRKPHPECDLHLLLIVNGAARPLGRNEAGPNFNGSGGLYSFLLCSQIAYYTTKFKNNDPLEALSRFLPRELGSLGRIVENRSDLVPPKSSRLPKAIYP